MNAASFSGPTGIVNGRERERKNSRRSVIDESCLTDEVDPRAGAVAVSCYGWLKTSYGWLAG